MAASDDAQVERAGLLGLLRSHVTLVVTLIPILLSGLRIFAVANGDRCRARDVAQHAGCDRGTARHLCLAVAHRFWGGGGDLLGSVAPAAIGYVATCGSTRRHVVARGVYLRRGAHLVCFCAGQ
jgi:hypothetical protein